MVDIEQLLDNYVDGKIASPNVLKRLYDNEKFMKRLLLRNRNQQDAEVHAGAPTHQGYGSIHQRPSHGTQRNGRHNGRQHRCHARLLRPRP